MIHREGTMETYRLIYSVQDFSRCGGSIGYFLDNYNPYDFLGIVHDIVANLYSRHSRDFGNLNKYYINKIPDTPRNALRLKNLYEEIGNLIDSNKKYLDVLVSINLFDDILVIEFARIETNFTVDELVHYLRTKEVEGERVPSEIYRLVDEFVESRNYRSV